MLIYYKLDIHLKFGLSLSCYTAELTKKIS